MYVYEICWLFVVSVDVSDHYGVCVIFEVKHDSSPKSIPFSDHSEANAEHYAANIHNEILYCSPPNSNPNENAKFIV